MKLVYIFSLLSLSLVMLGCASNDGSETNGDEEATATGDSSSDVSTKTAYEGSTGTGLLMERYKSGQIEGYRE